MFFVFQTNTEISTEQPCIQAEKPKNKEKEGQHGLQANSSVNYPEVLFLTGPFSKHLRCCVAQPQTRFQNLQTCRHAKFKIYWVIRQKFLQSNPNICKKYFEKHF